MTAHRACIACQGLEVPGVGAGPTSTPTEVAVRTYQDEEIPGLGHTELAWEDGLHIPGHQAVEDGVQQ